MTTKLLLLVAVVLGLFAVSSHAYVYGCTHTSSGSFYDLSPLSNCSWRGYQAKNSDNGDTFELNICQEVGSCGGNDAMCQNGQYGGGAPSSISFSDHPDGSDQGVVLTYSNGDSDGCGDNGSRSTVVTLTCDQNAQQAVVEFDSEQPECRYNFKIRSAAACPVQEAPQQVSCELRVFLVPHTHDDVGWLQTIDGYYESQVKSILDTSVAALKANPERKFIYVEQAYFTRWWYDSNTSDDQRDDLRALVKNGQWEFILGGWTMPDEACTTYGTMVDQMTLGHAFLTEQFGFIPTKGWQIDPFGSSSTTPTLSKLAGFDAQLIDRMTGKAERENTQTTQFWWQGSPSLGEKSKIFGEIMDGNPNGYCDWYFAFKFDEQTVDKDNVKQYADSFAAFANGRRSHILTTNMLAAWGCDFGFQNADMMFSSMDQVVSYLQDNYDTYGINVTYATLSEYWSGVLSTPNVDWPSSEGNDFFPYFDSLWWTGYFTSRVNLKGIVRQGEAVAHTTEQLYAIGRQLVSDLNPKSLFNQMSFLRIANADATHHDGVSGTSVPEVVQMYEDDIEFGILNADEVSSSILASMLARPGVPKPVLTTSLDPLINLADDQTIPLILYNNLGWNRTDFVNLPVNREDLIVLDVQQNPIDFQILPATGVVTDNTTSQYRLFFETQVPALGYQTYFVQQSSSALKNKQSNIDIVSLPLDGSTVLENDVLSVTVDNSTGLITAINNKASGVSITVSQSILKYISQNSGAYAFGPAGSSQPLSSSDAPKLTMQSGSLVSEITQEFPCDNADSYAKQTIRVFHSSSADNANYVELSYQLGVLPSQVELVSSFSTSIASNGLFGSDDNGYEAQVRNLSRYDGIEANYYPMVYSSYIKDDSARLSLIAERNHGTTSVENGQLEVMIHRNPDMGDGFGPGLTDTDVVYPSLRVIVDSPTNSPAIVQKQTYLMNFPLSVYLAQSAQEVAPINAAKFAADHQAVSQLGLGQLPPNLHLLSLNAVSDGSSDNNAILLRVTHIFAVDEDDTLSHHADFDIAAFFGAKFQVSQIAETTLTGNQVINANVGTSVTVSPKEIRTFMVQLTSA